MESRTQGSRPRPRTPKKSEAKDSLSEDRTSRGQGQPFRGQNLSRPRTAFPRTEPLEAKDRNARGQGQRHRPKCSKKKVFKKVFQAISNSQPYPEFLIWGGLHHKSHAMTSSKFSKDEVFAGQRYRRMEDLKSLPAGTSPRSIL